MSTKAIPEAAAPPVRLHPRRHWSWSRTASAVIVVIGVALLVRSLAGNENLDWPAVGHYMFNPAILSGVRVTIELTVFSQVLALVIGFLAAYALQLDNRVANAVSLFYIWFFRGTPVLVQLLFWYNLALVFPELRIGIPMTDLGHSWQANTLMTGFSAALLGLSFNEGAYMAEIFRGGILSVPRGQWDAALSMGLTRAQVLRRVVLPQAIRVIIPPTGNQFITLLKGSSLVAVIGGGDLLTRAQFIYGATYEVVPLLIVVCIWYLILVSFASLGQYALERRFQS